MAEQEFLNYAGDDGGNVSVPRRLRTRQNAPDVELSYITPEEAGILSVLRPGSPHRGPMEIPSYDAFDVDGGYRGSEARDYGGGTRAFGPSTETGQGLAGGRVPPDIAAMNKAQWDQRFTPYGQRTGGAGQGGQGFFKGVGGGIRNLMNRLRTVDGQVMPQSYFSEEERDKRRAQRSIDTIMNRKAPVTNLTQKRLGQLDYQGEMPRVGTSPAMTKMNDLGLYNERIIPGDAGVQVGADQNLRGTNELFDVDTVRQMINNAKSKNVTSLRGDDDKIQRFSLADMGIGTGDRSRIGGINGYTAEADPYLPGLEPINTMNNPTWNPVTQEFEYNMRDTSRVDDDISNLFAAEQLAFPGSENWTLGSGAATSGFPYSIWDQSGTGTGASPQSWIRPTGAQGGRVGYNTGGRVGILSIF